MHPFDKRILSAAYINGTFALSLAAKFHQHGYVYLPQLITDEALESAREGAAEALPHAKRLDLTMPGWLTPRHLSTLGAAAMAHHQLGIQALGQHPDLLHVASAITGDAVPGRHASERMALNWDCNNWGRASQRCPHSVNVIHGRPLLHVGYSGQIGIGNREGRQFEQENLVNLYAGHRIVIEF